MNQDFKNIEELLKHNKEILVIDLLSEALALEEIPYVKALTPAVKGLYITGSFESLLDPNKRYFFSKEAAINKELLSSCNTRVIDLSKTPSIPDVSDLKALLKAESDIYDSQCKLAISYADLNKYSRYIKPYPTIPANAIKVAIICICNYLNSLCKYTHVKSPNYTLESLIQKDHYDLIYNEEYFQAYEYMLDKVMDFIGKDTWHMYFYRIKGTSFILEKTVDYRIYEWYRMKFEKEQEELDDEDI